MSVLNQIPTPLRVAILTGQNAADFDATDSSYHFISAAVEQCFEQIAHLVGQASIEARLEPGIGAIRSQEMRLLDDCDIAIYDISNPTFTDGYEISILHALGKPVILIEVEPFHARPSYLSESFTIRLPDDDVETLAQYLERPFIELLGEEDSAQYLFHNPITQFYGRPLAQMSASTGLAAGYLHNFLRHILRESSPFFSDQNAAYDKINVIVPNSLNDVAVERLRIARRCEQEGLDYHLVSDSGRVADQPSAKRSLLLNAVGKQYFDVPVVLEAIHSSPEASSIRKVRVAASVENVELAETAKREILRVEKQFIRSFFDTLMYQAERFPGARADRLRFVTTDEFLSSVQNAAS